MKTFFLTCMFLVSSVCYSAAIQMTTLKKELPDNRIQYIHLISDIHFESALQLKNSICISNELLVPVYKYICQNQKKQLTTIIETLGKDETLVLIEDPAAFIKEYEALSGMSLINGLTDYFTHKNITAKSVECRHQNFGLLQTLISIPLGYMNDEIKNKIENLIASYDDGHFLNTYYQNAKNNLFVNNEKIRQLIIATNKSLKSTIRTNVNAALDHILGTIDDNKADNANMFYDLISGNLKEIKTDVTQLGSLLMFLVKNAGSELVHNIVQQLQPLSKYFSANFALIELLDVQILHHIYINPQPKHIFVCAGAAHISNVIPVLTTPEMGYTMIRETNLEERYIETTEEDTSSNSLFKFLQSLNQQNNLFYKFNEKDFITIFHELVLDPHIIEKHFENIMNQITEHSADTIKDEL